MSDIILRFIRLHGINIISDGDVDGVFATGILLRALYNSGIRIADAKIFFPRARERKGLIVKGSILVELRPERGLIYQGQNILIDHHPDPPRIVMYSGETPILIRKYNLSSSVAGLVHYVFEENSDIPDELVEAVDAVDFKNYEFSLARKLARAFLISRNLPNKNLGDIFSSINSECQKDGTFYRYVCDLMKRDSIYGYLLLAMSIGAWDEIFYWIESEAKRYEIEILPVAKKLYNNVQRRNDVSWIIYNYGDLKERTAVDDVLYELQRESKIAFMIGITKNGFLVRITTLSENLDLTKICTKIVHSSIDCGGRQNVIGLYFPNAFFSLKDVIDTISRIVKELGG